MHRDVLGPAAGILLVEQDIFGNFLGLVGYKPLVGLISDPTSPFRILVRIDYPGKSRKSTGEKKRSDNGMFHDSN